MIDHFSRYIYDFKSSGKFPAVLKYGRLILINKAKVLCASPKPVDRTIAVFSDCFMICSSSKKDLKVDVLSSYKNLEMRSTDHGGLVVKTESSLPITITFGDKNIVAKCMEAFR